MRRIIGIIMLAAALLVSGCSAEQPLKKLRIGVMSDAGAVPFILAQEQGIYKKLGLDIEIQVFKSAVDRDAALQTGNLDGAMADLLTVVFFNDAGFKVKMTSGTYGNYKMVSSPKLEAGDAAGLKALSRPIKAGISSNTVIEFATDQVAVSEGLESAIEKIAIPQMPVRLEMLRSGELDVATLPEPLASAAMLDGGSVIAGTEDYGLFPGVFLMTEAAVSDKQKEIELLYQGYDEAVDEINRTMTQDNLDAAKYGAYFDILVAQLGFPPVLKDKFYMPVLSHAKAADKASFERTLKWMQDASLTTSAYGFEELAEKSIK